MVLGTFERSVQGIVLAQGIGSDEAVAKAPSPAPVQETGKEEAAKGMVLALDLLVAEMTVSASAGGDLGLALVVAADMGTHGMAIGAGAQQNVQGVHLPETGGKSSYLCDIL